MVTDRSPTPERPLTVLLGSLRKFSEFPLPDRLLPFSSSLYWPRLNDRDRAGTCRSQCAWLLPICRNFRRSPFCNRTSVTGHNLLFSRCRKPRRCGVSYQLKSASSCRLIQILTLTYGKPMPSLFLRIKGVIELTLITFLNPVGELLDHCLVILNHLGKTRCCP